MHADALNDTCQSVATVERNGRPYCKRHDPEAKEARAEAKRRAALPREAYGAMQEAYIALERAARCWREMGLEYVADFCTKHAGRIRAAAKDTSGGAK